MITRNTALWESMRVGKRGLQAARSEAMDQRLARAVLDHLIKHFLLDSSLYVTLIPRPEPTEDVMMHPTELLTHAVIDPMRRLAMEEE